MTLSRVSKNLSDNALGIARAILVGIKFGKKGEGMRRIDCLKCRQKNSCCDFGVWIDLEEAKKILSLGLKGDFYHLERDKDFSSGYRVGTSYEDNRCSFLTPEGLCAIHKVDYNLKPTHCKEFPYENGKLSPIADVLCSRVKATLRSPRPKGRGKPKGDIESGIRLLRPEGRSLNAPNVSKRKMKKKPDRLR